MIDDFMNFLCLNKRLISICPLQVLFQECFSWSDKFLHSSNLFLVSFLLLYLHELLDGMNFWIPLNLWHKLLSNPFTFAAFLFVLAKYLEICFEHSAKLMNARHESQGFLSFLIFCSKKSLYLTFL